MKRWFGKKKADREISETRSRAAERIAMIGRADAVRWAQTCLSSTHRAWEDYEKNPCPATEEEVRRGIEMLHGVLDALEGRKPAQIPGQQALF